MAPNGSLAPRGRAKVHLLFHLRTHAGHGGLLVAETVPGAAEIASGSRATSQATTPHLRQLAAALVVACVASIFIGHIPLVIDAVGSGAAEFVRRQSEAPALVALIVSLWAIFAGDGHPHAASPEVPRQSRTSGLRWGGWFASLLVLSVLAVTWDSAPNAFITLKEAFAAAIVISLYLGWSCGFLPNDRLWRSGAPTASLTSRFSYYLGVLALTAVSYTSLPTDVLGEGVGVWLKESSEAFIAILLIPIYFDFVAGKRPWPVRAAWYGALVTVPLLVQFGIFPGPDSLGDWFAEPTEAFLAAIVISIFFDLLGRSTLVTDRETA